MAGFPARTATFKTLRQAERWARKIETDMDEGKHFRSVEARRRTLAEAVQRYLEEELPKKRNGSMHRSNLPWWAKNYGGLKLADVTPAMLVEARGKLAREPYTRAKPESKRTTLKDGEKPREYKRSPGTVLRYMSVLQHVFTVARKEWQWLSHNPFDGVSRPSSAPPRVRFLGEEERAALLKETAKDPVLHLLVVLALTTAARAGELWNLRWADIDLQDGRALLRKTKNAQPRTVWVHGETLKLLKEHGRLRRLGDDRIFASPTGRRYRYDKAFAAACKAAGIEDFRFHDLRHSAATYLARAGATQEQLKAIGGWKSSVVSRYVHLAAEDARGVLAKLGEKILGK
jgi:integrase